MKTLIIDHDNSQYAQPFTKYGEVACIANPSSNEVGQYDLICYVGGNDVDPSLYGHEKNYLTSCDIRTDQPNVMAHHFATELGIPVVGICKGAQQVFVLNGGTLFQHVTGHGQTHNAFTTDEDFKELQITSSHHQMMDLESLDKGDYKLLAWSSPRSTRYEYASIVETKAKTEPEVVFFPHTRQLAVQYHPEWMDSASAGARYFDKLVQELLLNES